MFKTLCQNLKHQGNEEKMKLHEKLRQIMPLLAQFNSQPSSKKPRLTLKLAAKNKSIFEDYNRQTSPEEKGKKYFLYEDVYRKLAPEKRAAPSERLLTENETRTVAEGTSDKDG
ncbi:unnamed protein product [Agarophyton chilense]